MKFICEQEKLVRAINIVYKAVSSRTTLPILKGILITCEAGKNEIHMSASDLEISIETKTEAIVERSGSIVVSAVYFSDLTRRLPEGNVSVEVNEKDIVETKSGEVEFTLQGIPSAEFPRIEEKEEGIHFSLDKEMLNNMIKGTVFAASTEEARGIITGSLIEVKKEEISMVALDGFRLALMRERISGNEEKNIIVSARVISKIGKLFSETEGEEDVSVTVGEKKVWFSIKETKIAARLLEGEFIKYKEVLPKENKTKVKMDRKEVLENVERAAAIVREGKNSFIRFSVTDEELIVSSRADEGTTRGVIKTEKEGENLEIGFNARFLGDMLKAIPDKDIVMEFNTSISPCLVKPTSGNHYEYLILPIRLSSSNI
ncbi:MAG: DNA polymerase III subunit beta [Clostridiales Family XIII bacterium]|nr:DNA polymerase III subunit beta [Clostridiales Family XIII bacterium]